MSNDKESEALAPVEDSQAMAKEAKQRTEQLDEEFLNARLLLYEALLEEYASLDQPPLDEDEVKEILEEGEEAKKKLEYVDRDELLDSEYSFVGPLTLRFYREMRKAQADKVERRRDELREEFKLKVSKFFPEEPDLNPLIDRAIT